MDRSVHHTKEDMETRMNLLRSSVWLRSITDVSSMEFAPGSVVWGNCQICGNLRLKKVLRSIGYGRGSHHKVCPRCRDKKFNAFYGV
jgi:hypothetical protein